jgi:hypothetical protein
MMRLNKITLVFVIAADLALTALVGWGSYHAGRAAQLSDGQRQAIERNCARYNPKTAQFEWLSEAKLPPMTSHDMGVALKDIRILEKASKVKETKRQ